MQFQIPQFIEVEDKIFGPLTFKQFIYLVGGGGTSFVLYSILPFFLAILLIIPVVALSLALAFYKINNKPFIGVLEAAFRYALGNKLYIWKKSDRAAIHKEESSLLPNVYVPKISDSKLKDLSWSLDVHQKIR